MAFEYQLYLCVVLASRLLYLRRDEATSWRFAGALGFIQGLLIMLLFGGTSLAWVTACGLVTASTLGGWLESRLAVPWCRLAVLAAVVLLPLLFALGLGNFELSSMAIWVGSVLNDMVGVVVSLDSLSGERFTTVFLALLLLANEVNIAMRSIFQALDVVPRVDSPAATLDSREYNAGRVIGILERWVMFLVMLLSNDWGAVGFIVAAKGLVRFDKLKDPVFAEYLLIGTLMSVLFAIAATWLVQ